MGLPEYEHARLEKADELTRLMAKRAQEIAEQELGVAGAAPAEVIASLMQVLATNFGALTVASNMPS